VYPNLYVACEGMGLSHECHEFPETESAIVLAIKIHHITRTIIYSSQVK